MRRLAIAVGLVLALAAAGVGAAIGASGSIPPAGHGAPATGATAANTTRLLSRPWKLRAFRRHRRVVVVRYTEGDCWGAARAHVTERALSVTIELLQRYSGGTGIACPQFLIVRNLSIGLKTPLGHRRLVHAPLSVPPGG